MIVAIGALFIQYLSYRKETNKLQEDIASLELLNVAKTKAFNVGLQSFEQELTVLDGEIEKADADIQDGTRLVANSIKSDAMGMHKEAKFDSLYGAKLIYNASLILQKAKNKRSELNKEKRAFILNISWDSIRNR